MKQLFLPVLIVISCASCNQSGDKDAANELTQNAGTQMQQVIHSLFTAASTVDAVKLFQLFEGSDSFIAINDGIKYSFQDYKKSNEDFFAAAKLQQFITRFQDVKVFDNDNALMTWSGSDVVTFKNDSTMNIKDYAVSFLMKRINGNWKVISAHESFPSASDPAILMTTPNPK